MKKLLYLLVACFCLSIAVIGCEGGVRTEEVGSTTKIGNSDVYEFVDPDTGVHYWIYSHKAGYGGMGGMTPRLNADGTVMITE